MSCAACSASSGDDHCAIMSIAASLAPPCNAPRSVAIAAVKQLKMSDSVDAHTGSMRKRHDGGDG